MPAVIIGGTGDHGVTQLGLACQLCLRQGGHTDEVHAPTAIGVGLCLCGEQRAFHADIGTALVYLYVAELAGGFQQELAECGTEGPGKGDVDNDSTLVKGVDTALSAIKELIGNNQVAGCNMFAETTHGTDGNNPFDAQAFKGPDIGTHRYLRGANAMPLSMARQT